MQAAVELREAGGGDLPFLLSLYCDVRGPEVAAWGWPAPQQDAFLRMQFEAQQRCYLAAYPESMHHVVCLEGIAIGRRLVACNSQGMHLVDISLLDAYRGRGIGTQLIQQLMDDCQAKRCELRLHVLRGNPAFRLYRRMGFRESSADPMYIQMAWAPLAGRPD
jgi:ribosomal protein S18 acetylase RimI-like enzyme